MERPDRTTLAGGCMIPLSIVCGLVWGANAHQLSIGLLAGLGVGLALALLVWLVDRARR